VLSPRNITGKEHWPMLQPTLNYAIQLDAYHVYTLPAVLEAQARCHPLTFQ
jgi:hypothetical protein